MQVVLIRTYNYASLIGNKNLKNYSCCFDNNKNLLICYLPPERSFPRIGILDNGFEEVALPVLFAAAPPAEVMLPAVLFIAPPADFVAAPPAEVMLPAVLFIAPPAEFIALLAPLVAFV